MPQINIQIDSPVLRLEEFSKRTGIPMRTAQYMISTGKLPIVPKATKHERPLVNMVAYTAQCAAASNI